MALKSIENEIESSTARKHAFLSKFNLKSYEISVVFKVDLSLIFRRLFDRFSNSRQRRNVRSTP